MKMACKFTLEELKYDCYDASCVSLANDDENIKAHKICLRKQRNCGTIHSAEDSSILLQIQANRINCEEDWEK